MFAEGVSFAVEFGEGALAAQGHLADVVGGGIEGRVDVDEIDLATVAVGEQVGEDFLVIAIVEVAAL